MVANTIAAGSPSLYLSEKAYSWAEVITLPATAGEQEARKECLKIPLEGSLEGEKFILLETLFLWEWLDGQKRYECRFK
ncbi:MAG: hypothetical protein ACOVS5_15760 [Oligoflexus sp.]